MKSLKTGNPQDNHILQPPTVIYVPDWPLPSPSQHIFTCRPYLIFFTEKLEIVSPVCVLMMVISSPKAMEFALSSIFLNVSQFTSLQNLKVCALVHCTLETSTWAKTAVGMINKNRNKKQGRKNLIPGIVVTFFFNLVRVALQWSATLQLKHEICTSYNAVTLYMRKRRVPIEVRQ